MVTLQSQLLDSGGIVLPDDKESRLKWVRLDSPNPAQAKEVALDLGLDLKLLEKSLDQDRRPATLERDGTLLITFMVARYRQSADEPAQIGLAPLSILCKGKAILSIGEAGDDFFEHMPSYLSQAQIAEEATVVLAYMFKEMGRGFIHALRRVNKQVDSIEVGLRTAIKNKQIFDLLESNKQLNQIAVALAANLDVLGKLERRGYLDAYVPHTVLGDTLVEIRQAKNMAETHNMNLSNLMDSYAAAVENNLSLLVQYLSVLVVVVAVPMGMAGIYGMNTPLPLQDEPYILYQLAGLSAFVAAVILLLMKWRRFI